MDTPPTRDSHFDRRWYPAGDPVEWVRSTRQTVFESATRCIAHAMAKAVGPNARPEELLASDKVFQELHICVDAYARGLFVLGQPADGVVGLILMAARDAAPTGELHPAIAAAIEQWCREADASVS